MIVRSNTGEDDDDDGYRHENYRQDDGQHHDHSFVLQLPNHFTSGRLEQRLFGYDDVIEVVDRRHCELDVTGDEQFKRRRVGRRFLKMYLNRRK